MNEIEIVEKEKKNERFFTILTIIMFVIIILFFLVGNSFGFIEHKPRIPTGNIDIFDINFNNCDCNCDNCNNCSNNETTVNGEIANSGSENTYEPNNNNNQEESKPDEPSIEQPPDTGLTVYDDDKTYGIDTKLNIFTKKSYYVVDDKIAPTSENSYQFVIRNNNDFNIKYNLEVNEVNKYRINMKYRLKLNGKYVVGDDYNWVTYDKLNQYNLVLDNYNYDVFTLDWKWFESSNDNQVGTDVNSHYGLNLSIFASQY